MEFQLNGKHALVTGSSQGIGFATAKALLAEGVFVALCSRSEEGLQAAKASLPLEWQERTLLIPADLSLADHRARLADTVLEQWGHVDILVHNTGGPPALQFKDTSLTQWQASVESLLYPVIYLSQRFIPGMQAHGGGSIVMLTSEVAKEPKPTLVFSNTLRAGLSALAKTMATELGPDNIRVNAILTGYTKTERLQHLAEIWGPANFEEEIPLHRLAEPEEIANAVVFLASQAASFITGVSLPVDGGKLKSF